MIPFKKLDSLRIASVSIGTGTKTVFQNTLDLYDDVKHFTINKNADIHKYKELINKLAQFEVVIVAFQQNNQSPPSLGTSKK